MIDTNRPTLIVTCEKVWAVSEPALDSIQGAGLAGSAGSAWQCLADPVAAATVVVNALRAPGQPSG